MSATQLDRFIEEIAVDATAMQTPGSHYGKEVTS